MRNVKRRLAQPGHARGPKPRRAHLVGDVCKLIGGVVWAGDAWRYAFKSGSVFQNFILHTAHSVACEAATIYSSNPSSPDIELFIIDCEKLSLIAQQPLEFLLNRLDPTIVNHTKVAIPNNDMV